MKGLKKIYRRSTVRLHKNPQINCVNGLPFYITEKIEVYDVQKHQMYFMRGALTIFPVKLFLHCYIMQRRLTYIISDFNIPINIFQIVLSGRKTILILSSDNTHLLQ